MINEEFIEFCEDKRNWQTPKPQIEINEIGEELILPIVNEELQKKLEEAIKKTLVEVGVKVDR